MTKTKATQAADLYSTARENPYVQRLVEDDELRDSLKNAFEAAKGAYGRATSNGSAVKAVTSDKKVQRDLNVAAENLRDASERLRAPKKRKKSRLGRIILLALVGAGSRWSSARTLARPCSTPSSAPRRSSSTPAPPASTAPDFARRRGFPPAAAP